MKNPPNRKRLPIGRLGILVKILFFAVENVLKSKYFQNSLGDPANRKGLKILTKKPSYIGVFFVTGCAVA